ncbi:MAG: protein TolQ [Deltaproteobacteria bacterium]|nr:protein TolQ [Deltaproteobacteria bacterium]MBW1815555.1 protein TolQ [Deltaproteobacteria bacterium]
MIEIPLMMQLPVALSLDKGSSHDIIQMIAHAGPMVKFVLLVLLLFSVFSWAIIFVKLRMLRKARRETEEFLDVFWETRELKKIHRISQELKYSPVAGLFGTGYEEFNRIRRIQSASDFQGDPDAGRDGASFRSQRAILDNIERSLRKATIDQINRLERATSFLATVGNTAPFIGLFGTVWGIMQAFRGIGLKGSASLAVVAPGISEALIATAAGLAAAIPAVIAFNSFTHKIAALRGDMDIFTSDLLSMIGRTFFKQRVADRTGGRR